VLKNDAFALPAGTDDDRCGPFAHRQIYFSENLLAAKGAFHIDQFDGDSGFFLSHEAVPAIYGQTGTLNKLASGL
jgi:hypothetical protein